MSMAAGAAVLRSLATKKIARSPPRLLRNSGAGLCLPSRFSTSTGGSMPPSANLRGPHNNNNNKIPSGNLCHRAIVAFIEAAPLAAFFLFGGIAYMHFSFSPALDRIEAKLERQSQAWVTASEDIKKIRERRTRPILLSNKESQIEATDVSEGWITGIGTK